MSIKETLHADVRLAEELTRSSGEKLFITGDRSSISRMFGFQLSDAQLGSLFGGIRGSHIRIEQVITGIDIYTSNAWFESPLYFSLEKDEAGISLTINDFFLDEKAPPTLGTRMIAYMIFQAVQIPGFTEIRASATRFFSPADGPLLREAAGYYFFPRLGFSGNPKHADDYVDIPWDLKGKNLRSIMRDPDLRHWWRVNGQTIDVKFRLNSTGSMRSLMAYLTEKGIRSVR